jgi:hypothetical protein
VNKLRVAPPLFKRPTSLAVNEKTCMRCHRVHGTSWHAASGIWNAVMRPPDGKGEERFGFCCPTCFMQLAKEDGHVTLGFCVSVSLGDYCPECRSGHPPCLAEKARADAAEKEKQHAEQKIEELTDGRCWDLKGCAHEGFPKCPWCQRDAAEERVRVLEKALRPLAALAKYYEDEAGSSVVTVYVGPNGPHVKLLPRHAHEAAAALAKEKT